jgi:hypothetical protein
MTALWDQFFGIEGFEKVRENEQLEPEVPIELQAIASRTS